jgi:hypothetical protein
MVAHMAGWDKGALYAEVHGGLNYGNDHMSIDITTYLQVQLVPLLSMEGKNLLQQGFGFW